MTHPEFLFFNHLNFCLHQLIYFLFYQPSFLYTADQPPLKKRYIHVHTFMVKSIHIWQLNRTQAMIYFMNLIQTLMIDTYIFL